MAVCFSRLLILIALSLFVCASAQTPVPRGHSSTFFCGKDWADSSKCAKTCPTGKDFECPAGESCFVGAECAGTVPASPSPSSRPNPAQSGGKEEKSKTSELWEWLGPTIGAISTLVGALIAVFCVRGHKKEEKEKPPNDAIDEV